MLPAGGVGSHQLPQMLVGRITAAVLSSGAVHGTEQLHHMPQ